MRYYRLTVAWVCALLIASVADADINGYELLSDWNLLPQMRVGVQAGLASSYDRSGSNNDYSFYESTGSVQQTDNVDPVTVVTLDGPGVITRFWMPHRTVTKGFKVKVLLDDVVVIDTTAQDLLGGNYGYMDGRLGSTLIGGKVSYEPIAYADSQTLKIVSENKIYVTHYYQWNYMKLPEGSSVLAYGATLTQEQKDDRAAAVSMIENVGANPAGISTSSVTLSTSFQSIGAGQSFVLGNISGSGRIRAINLKLDTDAADGDMDGLKLRIRYDGLSRAAVDVPVSQFFGAGHRRAPYQSMPLGVSEDNEFYSYWPMPYRRGVSVELYNESGEEISIDSAAVEYETGAVDDSVGYFHAVHREDNVVAIDEHLRDYHQLLDVSGRGLYVGNLLSLRRDGTSRDILEGDDLILVDGGDGGGGYTLYGTGLEDAYNGGYYYNHVAIQTTDGDVARPTSGTKPFHGLLIMEDEDSGDTHVRTDQYRWMIPDAVPFSDGIEVLQERHVDGAVFGSTAFYYLLPLFGDANGDMRVDLIDLAILRGTFDESGEGLAADFDEDGDVDLDDYKILAASFGMVASPGSPGAPEAEMFPDSLTAPEPASLMLLVLAAWPIVLRRRRY